MQIVLHTGAHYTDEERLMRCLLKNKADFAKRGVAVPGPSKYRNLLRETLNAMRTSPPAETARDVLVDAILDDETADRLILSNTNFFCRPRAALRNGVLYPMAANRLAHLSQLFPHDEIEMFIGIRNPATFIPAVFADVFQDEWKAFLRETDVMEIRWSDTLKLIREEAPQIRLTVWCNEDTPLIWAQIIREMAGLEHGEKIIGGFDLLAEIMTKEGMQRFRAYLKSHPVMSEMQKRRVITAFLDKFVIDEEIEEELDLPSWTEDLIEDMTEIYEEDVMEIERIPGVQIISP